MFDFIVIGGGLAGLYTAHHLSVHGSVALIARTTLAESNSYFAQGGIAAVIDETDTPHAHLLDTLEAGRGLCDEAAVRILTEEAPQRIDELIALGMKFDEDEGRLALGLEGGHHHKRILHAGGDATGYKITTFMTALVMNNPRIKVLAHHLAVDLITHAGVCCGLWVHDELTQTLQALEAKATVLATGGAAALFDPTTNPLTALGDGLMLAHEAGAELMDLEFIQFHPTALHIPHEPAFLISEAVRGEGAYLLDKNGQRFMTEKHPLAELAPRDVVAREIVLCMARDSRPYVQLSLRHLDRAHIQNRFPTIAAYCAQKGLDLTEEIPVAPAAHYTVGGVKVNLYGETSLQRLYAVGEVAATGVMGANRLASNSLIECLVFGRRIADHIGQLSLTPVTLTTVIPPFAPHEPSDATLAHADIRDCVGTVLAQQVGIIRDADGLRQAIRQIETSLARFSPYSSTNLACRMLCKRHSLARLIAEAALKREESRGGHYRTDYPQALSAQQAYHTIIKNYKLQHIAISHAH